MSDIGRLKRSGSNPFPSVRKSPDPFVPEMGEADFSQDVENFDNNFSTAVSEAEKVDQNIIMDENRRKQFRQRKRRQKKDEEGNVTEEDDIFVDISV